MVAIISRKRLFLIGCALLLFSSCTRGSGGSSLEEQRTKLQNLKKLADAAQAKAVTVCMKRSGFNYSPELPQKGLVATYLETHDLSEFRRTYGYGVFTKANISSEIGLKEDSAKLKNQTFRDSLNEESKSVFDSQLFGDKANLGCIGRSEKVAQVATYGKFAISYGNDLEEYASSPSLRNKMKDWSVCMKKKGWNFDTPTSIVGWLVQASGRMSTEEGRLTELRIGSDDSVCAG